MQTFLTLVLSLIICACSNSTTIGASSKTFPNPSPITHSKVRRGATVMLTLIWNIKDEKTGEEKINRLTITGVAVGHHHVLTSAALLKTLGRPSEFHVAIPDYETLRHKFVTKGEIVTSSSSGLLLLKTSDVLPSIVTISNEDGPKVNEQIKTVDVLNGSIPGVSHAGTVSFALEAKNQFGFLLIDVPSSQSSLGCGVYDRHGELVAIALGPSTGGGTINFSTINALSAKDIRDFLDTQNVSYIASRRTE